VSNNQKITKTSFKDIASTNLFFCNEDDNVSALAQLMRDNWSDTIFVKNDQGKVVGMITDGIIWDLIAKERGAKDPRSYRAKEIMYKNFIRIECTTPIDSIDQIRELFDKTPIQRIGLEKDGEIVGLVRRKFIERVKRYSRNFSFELK